jgi:hypothetical protein
MQCSCVVNAQHQISMSGKEWALLYLSASMYIETTSHTDVLRCPVQGVKLLGLLLTGSTGQHMAGRNGLA